MCSVSIQDDPLWNSLFHHHHHHHHHDHHKKPSIEVCFDNHRLVRTCLFRATFELPDLLEETVWRALRDSGRCGRVALADFVSRRFVAANNNNLSSVVRGKEYLAIRMEPLERMTLSSLPSTKSSTQSRLRRRKVDGASSSFTPYVLERSDVTCQNQTLEITARLFIYYQNAGGESASGDKDRVDFSLLAENIMTDETLLGAVRDQVAHFLGSWIRSHLSEHKNGDSVLKHMATTLFQNLLRNQLADTECGIAFVANGSILPRKSGASQAPMDSPPAVPFLAPGDSDMCRTLTVPMPRSLVPYLPSHLTSTIKDTPGGVTNGQNSSCHISITGLLIPRGVTLICGGGYHGKSTLLRTIAAGIYDKIPGDGREFCVTVPQALTIRAEDGRYVNNCNIGAFISNLPTSGSNGHTTPPPDTKYFSTGEASGSTSQAANVIEAVELRASAFLVDEDVSAANFMARDGRMRALVMDESITPFLYRVNGLFNSLGVSSVVVVGGVGDWLDVPHHVVLMQKYLCFDATAKARSISKQFSHGHVQYGGRGVVHRLSWDSDNHTPIPRRPTDRTAQTLDKDTTVVGLLDGGTGLVFHKIHPENEPNEESDDSMDSSDVNDESNLYIDLSRCEQLLGRKPQLFSCGLAALWVLEASRRNPKMGVSDLLDLLDREMDDKGVLPVLAPSDVLEYELVELVGHVYRPRRMEVGQAVFRLRGVEFEVIPRQEDGDAKAKALSEEQRKKDELMALWNSRRKNKLVSGE